MRTSIKKKLLGKIKERLTKVIVLGSSAFLFFSYMRSLRRFIKNKSLFLTDYNLCSRRESLLKAHIIILIVFFFLLNSPVFAVNILEILFCYLLIAKISFGNIFIILRATFYYFIIIQTKEKTPSV